MVSFFSHRSVLKCSPFKHNPRKMGTNNTDLQNYLGKNLFIEENAWFCEAVYSKKSKPASRKRREEILEVNPYLQFLKEVVLLDEVFRDQPGLLFLRFQ